MQLILIPGLWLVGSSWNEVTPVLEAAGHRVHALTLPGMGSRRLDRSGITLRDHVEEVIDIIDALEAQDPEKVVLVAHSAGGALAHAAADARPERVARVVYVASEPRPDGQKGDGGWFVERGEVALPPWESFGEEMLVGLDQELRALVRARSIPSPEGVVTGEQKLYDDRRYGIPITMVMCELPSIVLRRAVAAREPGTEELAKMASVSYLDLPTGHWPQFSRPQELGRVLALAVAG
ncbi:alpha/beta fold hydrolase [Nocardioides houyundeii]|uniref:alpha/beta fold hydrolase n=1 Tax=Nocardioides houyundeii TaxID=2045452 RepID=UPI000C786E00|nr:alpha/beta hydrolase [Nocardioides houyundeii]